MKLILLQDVKGKGKKGQMIEVSDGYGRNFLLPHNLAVEATPDHINSMRLQEKARRAEETRQREAAVATAAKLKDLTVKISAKAGEGGRLFGAITSKEISEELMKQHNIDIAKQKIVQEEQIKACGTYQVKCKLGFEISGVLKVVVTEAN